MQHDVCNISISLAFKSQEDGLKKTSLWGIRISDIREKTTALSDGWGGKEGNP